MPDRVGWDSRPPPGGERDRLREDRHSIAPFHDGCADSNGTASRLSSSYSTVPKAAQTKSASRAEAAKRTNLDAFPRHPASSHARGGHPCRSGARGCAAKWASGAGAAMAKGVRVVFGYREPGG